MREHTCPFTGQPQVLAVVEPGRAAEEVLLCPTTAWAALAGRATASSVKAATPVGVVHVAATGANPLLMNLDRGVFEGAYVSALYL